MSNINISINGATHAQLAALAGNVDLAETREAKEDLWEDLQDARRLSECPEGMHLAVWLPKLVRLAQNDRDEYETFAAIAKAVGFSHDADIIDLDGLLEHIQGMGGGAGMDDAVRTLDGMLTAIAEAVEFTGNPGALVEHIRDMQSKSVQLAAELSAKLNEQKGELDAIAEVVGFTGPRPGLVRYVRDQWTWAGNRVRVVEAENIRLTQEVKRLSEVAGVVPHLEAAIAQEQAEGPAPEQPETEVEAPTPTADPDISEATGLKVGESEELKAPNGKKVILERTTCHQPLGDRPPHHFDDVERYTLRTPRDRQVADLALRTNGKWQAVISFHPSPNFATHLEALEWIWARDKYTGGTSPAQANQAEKTQESPAETHQVEAETQEVAPAIAHPLPAGAVVRVSFEHGGKKPVEGRVTIGAEAPLGTYDEPIEGYKVVESTIDNLKAIEWRDVVQVLSMPGPAPAPEAIQHEEWAAPLTRGTRVDVEMIGYEGPGVIVGQTKIAPEAPAPDGYVVETPKGKRVLCLFGCCTEVQTPAPAPEPEAPAEEPQDDAELAELRTQLEQLPEATFTPGEAIVALVEDTKRLVEGVIVRGFDGSTRFSIQKDGGGMEVVPAENIRRRGPLQPEPVNDTPADDPVVNEAQRQEVQDTYKRLGLTLAEAKRLMKEHCDGQEYTDELTVSQSRLLVDKVFPEFAEQVATAGQF